MIFDNILWDFVLRLAVAGTLGASIGLEREYRAKGAGFRTHILVAIGSALIMIVSMYGFMEVVNGDTIRLDPSRVAASVVTGIGFIGAGTIMIQKQFIRGLTTAAGIWATAGIGLAVGGGMYWLGVAATVFVLAGMELFSLLFKRIGIYNAFIRYSTTNKENLQRINQYIMRRGCTIVNYDLQQTLSGTNTSFSVEMIVRTQHRKEEDDILKYIQSLPDLLIERFE